MLLHSTELHYAQAVEEEAARRAQRATEGKQLRSVSHPEKRNSAECIDGERWGNVVLNRSLDLSIAITPIYGISKVGANVDNIYQVLARTLHRLNLIPSFTTGMICFRLPRFFSKLCRANVYETSFGIIEGENSLLSWFHLENKQLYQKNQI